MDIAQERMLNSHKPMLNYVMVATAISDGI